MTSPAPRSRPCKCQTQSEIPGPTSGQPTMWPCPLGGDGRLCSVPTEREVPAGGGCVRWVARMLRRFETGRPLSCLPLHPLWPSDPITEQARQLRTPPRKLWRAFSSLPVMDLHKSDPYPRDLLTIHSLTLKHPGPPQHLDHQQVQFFNSLRARHHTHSIQLNNST